MGAQIADLTSQVFINGEKKPASNIMIFDEFDTTRDQHTAKTWFNYDHTIQSVKVGIGTETELLFTLNLEPKQFRSGKQGWATQCQEKWRGKTCHVRANIVSHNGGHGVTVAISEPESETKTAAWAGQL